MGESDPRLKIPSKKELKDAGDLAAEETNMYVWFSDKGDFLPEEIRAGAKGYCLARKAEALSEQNPHPHDRRGELV